MLFFKSFSNAYSFQNWGYSWIFPSFSWGIFGNVTCFDQSHASEKYLMDYKLGYASVDMIILYYSVPEEYNILSKDKYESTFFQVKWRLLCLLTFEQFVKHEVSLKIGEYLEQIIQMCLDQLHAGKNTSWSIILISINLL